MKKLLTIAAFMLAAVVSNAQVKFGPKVGLNFSTMSMKSEGVSLDTKMRTGFHVGAILEKDITSSFFIQPGIFFSSKGSKYDALDGIKIVANYIDIPVNVGYKLRLCKSSNLRLMAGPYFAYGVGGTATETIIGEHKEDIKWGSGNDDDLKPFDMGLNLGAAVELNSFQVGLQYGFGLLNISADSDATIKNGVLSLSVAYLF